MFVALPWRLIPIQNLCLKVFTGLIGFSLATMYPSGLLWSDKLIHVSYKVGALFLIHAPMHFHVTMDPWIPIAAYIGTIHI